MNSLIMKLKKFLKNKNTITILGVILIIALLYFGYSYTINKAVEPQRVPVAVNTIDPRTKITEDMIEYIDVPATAVKDNVIRNSSQIIGKYSNVNTVIPAGSMFYTDTVIEEEELPDIVYSKLKKGEIIYSFSVNMESTLGNSIYPGNYIDIYMKSNDTNDKVMIGKLIENVEVLAVNDSSGNPVFESSTENRTPAWMLFGLQPDLYILLKKASYMSGYGVELYPVPHGDYIDDYVEVEGATRVSIDYLKDFITANTVDVPINTNDNEHQALNKEE